MKQSDWKSVLRLEKNKDGKDFVCGDIHGCFSDLEEKLIDVGFDKNTDRLFCVGDLIERGPESEKAADYIEFPWFYSVLGNHEEMFLMAITDPADIDDSEDNKYYKDNHVINGKEWANRIRKLYQVVDRLPLIIQVGDVIIAHAALPAVQTLEDIENDPWNYFDSILWDRESIPTVLIPSISKIYVGHTIVRKPTVYGLTTYIDTGAYLKYRGKKGELTILEIGEEIL
jgi:serine/threonine protein phosphatase 1